MSFLIFEIKFVLTAIIFLLASSLHALGSIPCFPYNVFVEIELAREETTILELERSFERSRQFALLWSRVNPSESYRIGTEMAQLGETIFRRRQNLELMRSIGPLVGGNPEPIAYQMYIASGGIFRVEVLPNNKFNIWGREGTTTPIQTDLTRDELIYIACSLRR